MPTDGGMFGGLVRAQVQPEWMRRRAKPKSYKGSKAAKKASRRPRH